MKSFFQISAATALCLAILSTAAWARGNGHGNGRPAWTQNHYADWNHDRDRDDWQARHRERPDIGIYNGVFGSRPERRPPGWDRGRKTGWGNCDLPPGQAKKYGCRSSFFARHPQRRTVVVFERHSTVSHRNHWHPPRREHDRD